jgi:hypothetical protein
MPTSTTSDNPVEVFNQLSQVVDIKNLNCKLYDVNGNVCADNIGIEITSRAAALSFSLDGTKVTDIYLLTLDFVFDPSFIESSREALQYTISIFGLDALPALGSNQSSPFENPPQIVQPCEKLEILKTSPPTTEGSTTFSSEISETYRGNIGFVGTSPTGVSAAVSLSNTKSFTVADVTLVNQSVVSSKPNKAIFEFNIASGAAVGKSTFQPTVQVLFCNADEVGLDKERTGGSAQSYKQPTALFAIQIDVKTYDTKLDSLARGISTMYTSGACTRYIGARMPKLPKMDN